MKGFLKKNKIRIRADLNDKNEIISFCSCIIAVPDYVKDGD